MSMQENNTNKRDAVFLIAFLVAVFVMTWLLTAMTPLVGDDFNYAFSWSDHSRVDNFTLVYKSMKAHRKWTHGRVYAQGWVTLFMMWPKWVFSVANAGIVTAFFSALYHYFRRKAAKMATEASAAVALLYWVCMPAFGQVFLWLDGACNYFWGAALSWILLELELSMSKTHHKLFFTLMLLPLAFISGAWSEHISFALLVILALNILRTWIRNKKWPVSEILVLLTGCAGYLFLMLAPSMLPSALRSRAMQAAGKHINEISGFILNHWWVIASLLLGIILICFVLKKMPDWNSRLKLLFSLGFAFCSVLDVFFLIKVTHIQNRQNTILDALVSSSQIGFLSLIACYFACLSRAFHHKIDTEAIIDAVILGTGGVAALLLFALAMYVPARGFCAPVVYIGIATVRLMCSMPRGKTRKILVSVLLCVFAISFTAGILDVVRVHRAAIDRDKAISAALASDGVLVASPYPVRTKFSAQYGIPDLTDDGSWPNDIIIEYYGLNDICVVPDEE